MQAGAAIAVAPANTAARDSRPSNRVRAIGLASLAAPQNGQAGSVVSMWRRHATHGISIRAAYTGPAFVVLGRSGGRASIDLHKSPG